MNRLSVKRRILILSILSAVGIVLMGGMLYWSSATLKESSSRIDLYDSINLASETLQADTLETRRDEKDFLLRRDMKYANEAKAEADKTARHAQDLAKISETSPVADRIQAIVTGMTRYHEQFDVLTASMEKAGLDEDSGYQGALRKAAHGVEEMVDEGVDPSLWARVLLLRRHEKDYLLRGDAEHMQEAETEYKALLEYLPRSNLSVAERERFTTQIGVYMTALREMVESDTDVRAKTKELSDIYSTFSSAFDDIRDFSVAQAKKVREDAAATERRVGIIAIVFAVLCAVFTFSVAQLVSRSIVKPIEAMTGVMAALSGGDRQVAVPYADGTDEIAAMARSVQVFKDGLIRAEALEAEARVQQQKELERAERRMQLTAGFDEMIGRMLDTVASTVSRVHEGSDAMQGLAAESGRQSDTVADAAKEASTNVQTVASATEELSASTSEISNRVQDTVAISQGSVTDIDAATHIIEELREATDKIGAVIQLIQDIATQTNLLALNATIEAARAGDAGKGFVVVANEVKHLATQTDQATRGIQTQIDHVQKSTRSAVDAIGRVHESVRKVDSVITSIAGAVEQQNAATTEISRNVQEVSEANHSITSNITEVAHSTHSTGEMARVLYDAASEMRDEATTLRSEVETFLENMRNV